MAVIQSGSSNALQDVDAAAKAARVTIYDQAGNPITFPAGLTDAQLRANPIPVSGTFFQATQPVSGTVGVSNFPASQAVTGTFFQATQPVSGAFFQATQPVSGPLTDAQLRATAPTVVQNELRAATLAVTATGAAAAAVTATLPAVAGQFHYITSIELVAYSTVARTGGVTPVIVTSTNLPGTPAWTLASAAAVGATDRIFIVTTTPLRSAAANTPTTIVGPATASIIWRLNVQYFTAP